LAQTRATRGMAVVLKSELRKLEGAYVWRIGDFDARVADVGSVLLSPKFDLAGHAWKLKVYPNGEDPGNEGHVSAYLTLQDSSVPRPVVTKFILSPLKAHESPVSVPITFLDSPNVKVDVFRNSGVGRGQPKFMLRRDALDPAKRYLAKGIFSLQLELRVFQEAFETVEFPGSTPESPATPRGTVQSALRAVLASGDSTDVEMRVGDRVLRAHKLLLSARSAVFKAMLEGGMREGLSKVIELPDVDPDSAQAMLEFMYSDDCAALDSPDGACHLLKLAHRFGVNDLARSCLERLQADLTGEHAVERFMLADELGLDSLRAACTQYLAVPGHLAEAQSSEPWERLVERRPHLAAEVLRAVVPPSPRGSTGGEEGKTKRKRVR